MLQSAVLVALVAVQIFAKKFHPLIYWTTIVASTTAGTTLADFSTRSLGIGYVGGSTLLLSLVLSLRVCATKFASQDMLAEAAMAGAGAVLLSPWLFRDLLHRERLIAPFSARLRGPDAYFVLRVA